METTAFGKHEYRWLLKEKLCGLLDQLKPTQVIETPREERSRKQHCQCFANALNYLIFLFYLSHDRQTPEWHKLF